MDLRTLKHFLHLADSLHFARSAEALHLSPSTLSRSIQRLEDELGQTLFERDNRAVRLTPAGVRFRHFAHETWMHWQQLKSELNPDSDHLKGELHIYCSVTASYSHLPQLIQTAREKLPKLEIRLSTGDPSQAIQRVLDGDVDLAIAPKLPQLSKRIEFVTLSQMSLELIGPVIPGQVQQQLTAPMIDWNQIPLIVPEHGPAKASIDAWLKARKINPPVYAQVSAHEPIVSMVAVGCGVGIVPKVVIENSPLKDQVRPLDPGAKLASFEVGICTLKQRLNEPLLNALWKSVLGSF